LLHPCFSAPTQVLLPANLPPPAPPPGIFANRTFEGPGGVQVYPQPSAPSPDESHKRLRPGDRATSPPDIFRVPHSCELVPARRALEFRISAPDAGRLTLPSDTRQAASSSSPLRNPLRRRADALWSRWPCSRYRSISARC